MWDLSLETKNHWMEIDKSEISMKRVLGSGNFGEVWYGKYRMLPLVVLVKLLRYPAIAKGKLSLILFLENQRSFEAMSSGESKKIETGTKIHN